MADAPLWRAADLADVYGVDESTVHRWERSGKLRRARRDPGGCKYEVTPAMAAPIPCRARPASSGGALLDVAASTIPIRATAAAGRMTARAPKRSASWPPMIVDVANRDEERPAL